MGVETDQMDERQREEMGRDKMEQDSEVKWRDGMQGAKMQKDGQTE